MRILITGGLGQLGRRLSQAASVRFAGVNAGEVVAFSRAELDICDAEAVDQALRDVRPDVVFNTAAYTAVDAAEKDADRAFEVNRDGAAVVATACCAAGVQLVHISTDYVFSGGNAAGDRPHLAADPVAPVGVYARSKFAGEQAVLAACPSASVVRTGWLYDSEGRNFLTTMLHLAAERTVITVVADQVGCPTHAGAFAEDLLDWAVLGAGALDISGVHHYGHAGQASWFSFAQRIFSQARSEVQVMPITTAEFPTAAERPAWSKLDEGAFFAALGRPPVSWEAALDRCLKERA